MPNYIKNKIVFQGSELSDLAYKSIYEKFSTFYPSEPHTNFLGQHVYKNKLDSNLRGFFDEKTNIFHQRDKEDINYIPDDFEREFTEAWTRFPDFEKVFPTPESIKLVGDSIDMNIIDCVKAKYYADVSSNALIASMESVNRKNAKLKEGQEAQFELACKAYEETGFCYWYDFNVQNWGTKWNAFECEKISNCVFTFETACSGVPNIVKEISKHFNGLVIYKYSDEDTGCNTGHYVFNNGKVEFENLPANYSCDAFDIFFELKPNEKENYVLVDGNYKDVEVED